MPCCNKDPQRLLSCVTLWLLMVHHHTKLPSSRQTKKTVLGPCGHPDYRRKSRSTPTHQEVMGLHEGDAQKAELLNRQFQTAFSSKEQSTEEEFAKRCPMPQLDPTHPLYEDINITVSGIEKLLKQLNPTKTSRPNNISPRVLKEVASEIAPSLILIYRASIKSGTVPKDWKSAHTAPHFHERKMIQA